MRPYITIRLDRKNAKKLLAALEKGVYSKLTPGQADEIADFIYELRCSVMEEDSR